MFRHDGLRVDWLGYATVRVEGADAVVYLDPGRYGVLGGERSETPRARTTQPARADGRAGTSSGVLDEREPGDADLVCVTHDHHYDSDAVRAVAGANATLVVFEGVNTHRIDRDVERPADLPLDVRTVDDEADVVAADVVVRTVPAYNHPDGPRTDEAGEPIHPEGFGCGYHLTVRSEWDRDVTVFWPGDTDVLAGHERLDVSLFLPPIGGAFTMDRHEAAALAAAIDPDLLCPVHYDTFDAIEADAGAFAADVAARGVPVVLDEP